MFEIDDKAIVLDSSTAEVVVGDGAIWAEVRGVATDLAYQKNSVAVRLTASFVPAWDRSAKGPPSSSLSTAALLYPPPYPPPPPHPPAAPST